jgi:transposase
LARGWAKRGQRLRVLTRSAHHERLNLFGWVAPLLGRRGLLRRPQGNREGFLTTLRHLRRRLRGYTIWLYVDRARWHKGLPVDHFLAAQPDLHLEYLPAYQPGLNAEERIWRQLRYDATSNQYFDTLDDMWATVRSCTQRWSPALVTRLCQIS